jgi:hypothetical protein
LKPLRHFSSLYSHCADSRCAAVVWRRRSHDDFEVCVSAVRGRGHVGVSSSGFKSLGEACVCARGAGGLRGQGEAVDTVAVFQVFSSAATCQVRFQRLRVQVASKLCFFNATCCTDRCGALICTKSSLQVATAPVAVAQAVSLVTATSFICGNTYNSGVARP